MSIPVGAAEDSNESGAKKREIFRKQKSKFSTLEGDEGTEEHLHQQHRDILREFVDQSFERAQEKDNVRRAREMPVSQKCMS